MAILDNAKRNSICAMAVWRIKEYEGKIYSSSVSSYYINYLSANFESVYVISDYETIKSIPVNLTQLNLPNVTFVPIRTFGSYIEGTKRFRDYYKAVKSVKDKVDYFYCRVPDLFSWMPRLLFSKKTIMHFVGDTIDATQHNEKWSSLKKAVMISGYYPDYRLTVSAARKSVVYTNGFLLMEKLKKYGVKAKPVISSTVSKNDLPDILCSKGYKNGENVRLIYIGYIRFAKGINTIMRSMELLKRRNIDFHFDVVGNGEMFEDFKNFVKMQNLEERVTLHGLINDRSKMNNLLQQADLFIFPSLSEGSPRVVIEAMSQGTPVVSTPVGSVPYTFKERESIHLFDFNDAEKVVEIVSNYINDPTPFIKTRFNAFVLVKKYYTRERFMEQIFSYNEA